MSSRRIALAAAFAALLVPSIAVAAPPPGNTLFASGPLTGGGTWDFSAKRTSIQGVKGVCLDLTPTFADGSGPGGGGGCIAGSLKAAKGIGDVAISSKTGETTTTSLVGGLVYSRAKRVKITFADGKTLRLKTHRPPKGWRRLLKTRVRYYAGDALAVTAAKQAKIAIFDKKGHRISRMIVK
jgi:hypothetical protein